MKSDQIRTWVRSGFPIGLEIEHHFKFYITIGTDESWYIIRERCLELLYGFTGDCAGGHLTAAQVMLWRRKVIEAQRASNTYKDAALPPIRMQKLIYPGLQMINSTTFLPVMLSDPLHGRRAFCKAWTWLAFPDHVNDKAVVRALCANNHTTRAARERLTSTSGLMMDPRTRLDLTETVKCKKSYLSK